MKLTILLFLFSLLLTSTVLGQKKSIQLYDKKFSHEIEEELAAEKLFHPSASYYYTYIGDYQKALKTYELPLDWGLDSLTREDSIDFLNYKLINAKEYLAERTKQEQIVIISEAHHKPQHRIFTAELLEMFYANGYRYLGIEAILPSYSDTTKFLTDTDLNDRGYPLDGPISGTYTREPQMSNMIRKAIDIGFEIFGYESTTRGIERDLEQAMVIERFMNSRPEGKVVIQCGWYHAIESDYPKRKSDHWMAYHFKERTGIDPLTIYQDALSEKSLLAESPFYQMIDSKEVGILVDKEGKVFNGVAEKAHYDILIYHPRTTFIKNRPNWLVEIKGNQFVAIDKTIVPASNYPIIVEAFLEGEENSVPIDVVELKNSAEETELLLKKGNYKIKVTDKNRSEIEYFRKVK